MENNFLHEEKFITHIKKLQISKIQLSSYTNINFINYYDIFATY